MPCIIFKSAPLVHLVYILIFPQLYSLMHSHHRPHQQQSIKLHQLAMLCNFSSLLLAEYFPCVPLGWRFSSSLLLIAFATAWAPWKESFVYKFGAWSTSADSVLDSCAFDSQHGDSFSLHSFYLTQSRFTCNQILNLLDKSLSRSSPFLVIAITCRSTSTQICKRSFNMLPRYARFLVPSPSGKRTIIIIYIHHTPFLYIHITLHPNQQKKDILSCSLYFVLMGISLTLFLQSRTRWSLLYIPLHTRFVAFTQQKTYLFFFF